MSVYIKGMNVPTSCNTCPMLEGDGLDGLCHAASRWLDDDEYWRWFMYSEEDVDDNKPLNCPLVEVPVPHGRLIDADMVLSQYNGSIRTAQCDYAEGLRDAAEDIKNTPTIIEAEEGEAALREGGNHETTD